MKEGDRCLLQDDCCEGLHCHTSNQTSTCEPSAAAGHARPDPTLFFKVAKESAAVSFAKPIPHISEQFIVKTTEIDNGTVIVRQTLIWDVENQRSHMIADGKLSHGHLEEITRCDVGWTTGYSLILGGPGTNVSSWECKNRTLNPSPSTCQWSKFFDFPTNASYVGKEEITWHNGTGPVTCDAWTYWTMNQQYKFYTIFNTAIPARSSLIYTANPGYHLYHIDFTDFSAGSPPLEDFNPPKGIHCPNATDYKQEQEQEQVAQSTTNNVRHLLLPKIKVTTERKRKKSGKFTAQDADRCGSRCNDHWDCGTSSPCTVCYDNCVDPAVCVNTTEAVPIQCVKPTEAAIIQV